MWLFRRQGRVGLSAETRHILQDALQRVVQLDIHYLWVDSLYIIQHNQEDLMQELPAMANIYRNAFLTISAACASSSDEGFLRTRENLIAPPSLEVQGMCQRRRRQDWRRKG